MKNRAKCKLCGDILESFHRHDFVTCSCGEISIDGGNDYMKCSARDWRNFLRVDDQDNIIIPKIVEEASDIALSEETSPAPSGQLSKLELLEMLSEMVKNIEKLPSNAMSTPVTHYDLLSALMLLESILRRE